MFKLWALYIDLSKGHKLNYPMTRKDYPACLQRQVLRFGLDRIDECVLASGTVRVL